MSPYLLLTLVAKANRVVDVPSEREIMVDRVLKALQISQLSADVPDQDMDGSSEDDDLLDDGEDLG